MSLRGKVPFKEKRQLSCSSFSVQCMGMCCPCLLPCLLPASCRFHMSFFMSRPVELHPYSSALCLELCFSISYLSLLHIQRLSLFQPVVTHLVHHLFDCLFYLFQQKKILLFIIISHLLNVLIITSPRLRL